MSNKREWYRQRAEIIGNWQQIQEREAQVLNAKKIEDLRARARALRRTDKAGV